MSGEPGRFQGVGALLLQHEVFQILDLTVSSQPHYAEDGTWVHSIRFDESKFDYRIVFWRSVMQDITNVATMPNQKPLLPLSL